MMMDARIDKTMTTMTPMNQGASLHSPTTPRGPRASHLRMEPQLSAKGMHVSPILKSKFISSQTAKPTKAKNSIQVDIRTIVLSELETLITVCINISSDTMKPKLFGIQI